jgi:hypothetical protein
MCSRSPGKRNIVAAQTAQTARNGNRLAALAVARPAAIHSVSPPTTATVRPVRASMPRIIRATMFLGHRFGRSLIRRGDGVIALEFGSSDLLRCRFAVSPLWETVAALRCLLFPQAHTLQLGWIRAQPAVGSLRLGALHALLPERGHVPDFLTPPPARRAR